MRVPVVPIAPSRQIARPDYLHYRAMLSIVAAGRVADIAGVALVSGRNSQYAG
ncbi:MAG: hypothetical protein WBC71_16165 [Salaquimonas sp.]